MKHTAGGARAHAASKNSAAPGSGAQVAQHAGGSTIVRGAAGSRKWLASIAAGSLVAGMLVAAGLGGQQAAAAGPAPSVEVTEPDSFIAGEDLTLDLRVSSDADDGNRYNLSAGVVLPAGARVVDSGTLGSPRVYAAGTVLPGSIAQGTTPDNCAALGLENAPSGAACRVPAGKQYLVYQNISDLPAGASADHSITVRPDADEFEVGTDIPYQVNVYTSSIERFIPVFPGSTGVNSLEASNATSNAGIEVDEVPVEALRLDKSEPSPESELLRGVHQNTTTYTLRVWHTGQGNIEDVVVTDLIPAGLEYLGLGGVDNTTNANGNRPGAESVEYDGAARLTTTPTPADSSWRNVSDATLNANTGGETVETVMEDGAVYTKVTWNIGELLASGHASFSLLDPITQVYTAAADTDTVGEPGFIEIRYRAAVPLFENTMDFGPNTPGITGEQASNLDNNTGPSTRHGIDGTDPANDAKTYTNRAEVTGTYAGATVGDDDTETIDAVDVRLLKTVDSGDPENSGVFYQGNNARYTLNIATSEYVSAELSGDRPNRLVDDLADGLCPVFPAGTNVTPGASGAGADIPRLLIGDPSTGAVGADLSVSDWNAALTSAGVSADCHFTSSKANTSDDALEGATLSGIAFNPETGHFFLDLALVPSDVLEAGLSAGHDVRYSAAQNTTYNGTDNTEGATTSGDRVTNTAEIHAATQSIDPVRDLSNSGGHDAGDAENAWDDSNATLEAELSSLSKMVLQREAGVPAPNRIAAAPADGGPAAEDWVSQARTPFAVGDEVWYRIQVTPPRGADVRNPKLTDFLPDGVEFDAVDSDNNGRPDNIWVQPSSNQGIGSCSPTQGLEWVNTFVPFSDADVQGNVLNFELGSSDCLPGSDRFMPLNTTLSIYIKVTVTDQSAFGEVDLSQNLAKYQQENVNGEIHFLRDDAEVTLAQDLKLVKGVRDITRDGVSAPTPANGFGSDVDEQSVVQNDRVTYRIDVTAPQVDSTGYVIWDALPEGVTSADIDTDAYTAALVTDGAEGAALPGSQWEANVFDAGNYPDEVEADLRQNVKDQGRSIIVWTISGEVPGSTVGDESAEPVVPAVTRGLTLGYTLVVPDGTDPDGGPAAQLTQRYVNDASIVQYEAVSNGAGTTTLVPEGDGTLSTRAAEDIDGAYPVPAEGTFDPSDIHLPNATIVKQLLSTEIGPNTAPNPPGGEHQLDSNNLDDAIVQGEHATFQYSVTIPAHTTVRDAQLSDQRLLRWTDDPSNPSNRQLAYHFVDNSAQATYPTGVTETGFTLHQQGSSEAPGTLEFPAVYTNATNEPQVFSVSITAWIDDRDASNSTRNPDFPNDKQLTNTAEFGYTAPSGAAADPLTATANVQYLEPNLGITKSADPDTDVSAGDEITYTLTVTNANRVKSYDNTVVDTVPSGLVVDTTQAALAGATFLDNDGADTAASLDAGEGGVIRWSYEQFSQLAEIPTNATLTYDATIEDTTGGGQDYVNTAQVKGYTLPATVGTESTEQRRGDRVANASETVTAETAAIEKQVRVYDSGDDFDDTASTPIGQTVEYQVQATLQPNINYYNARIVDAFSGSGIGTPVRTDISGPTSAPAGSVQGTWSANNGVWTIDNAGSPHIEFAAEQRTLTITYRVTLEPGMTADELANDVELQWTTRPGGNIDNPNDRRSVDDDATVTILNPELDIEKKIDTETPINENFISVNPDQSFDYQLRVFQTANGNTPAHNITVVDQVPAGVIIDTDSLTVDGTTAAQGQATWEPGVTDGTGGTITWTLAGPLAQRSGGDIPEILLGYSGEFVESTDLSAQAYENVVNLTEYESFGTGGREYVPGENGVPEAADRADVTPLFPQIDPVKTVTTPVSGEDYGLAYVGEAFNWTLTITNNGDGQANAVDVIDTLPVGWEYVGNAQIRVGNGAAVTLGAPTQGTSGDNATLTWDADALEEAIDDLFPLAGDGSFVITFDARPTEAAIISPGAGTGLEVGGKYHRNTVAVDNVTDAQNNTENADGGYKGDNSTADAYIAEADLRLVKEAIGGVVEQSDPDTNLHGLTAGTWVPGQGVLPAADDQSVYAQPQWQLTVTNHGPDASSGPFEIVDTQTLPAGVEVTNWTVIRHPAGGGAPQDLALTGSGTAASPFVIGTEATSLNAEGTDRIVITGDVSIGASSLASGTQLSNIASVDGATFERESNKPETADNPNTDEAAKPLSAQADLAIEKSVSTPEADLGAGKPITWNLQVTNLGPSTSVSSDVNITVTDTVPDGIFGVTDPSVTGVWAATTPDGWPAEARDEITWTYQGESITPGQQIAPIVLSGTVEPAHTAQIVNVAEVVPGDTPDPNDPNNESEVPFTPGTGTEITIDKTRVVQNAAGDWVAAGDLDPVPAPVPGENVSYRITVVNNGPAVARDVHVLDDLPDYLTFVSVANGVGEWSTTNVVGDSDLRFDLDDPAPLASPVGQPADSTENEVSFILTTLLDSDFVLDDNSVVANEATAVASNADPDTDGDSSNTPSRSANLTIAKTHSGDPIAGTSIPYTIMVTNTGPSASRGPITVGDVLPEGLSYVANSARVSVGGSTAIAQEPTVAGNSLSWSIGTAADTFSLPVHTAAVNGTIVVTLNVLIDSNITNGVKQNTAKADGPDGPEVTTTDEIEVERQAEMALVKKVEADADVWVDETGAIAGETKRYLLTVTNEGPSANPATLVDELPEHLTLVSVTPVDPASGWDCATSVVGSQTATCAHAQLPVGETTIEVIALLDAGAVTGAANQQDDFENIATLTWSDRRTTDTTPPHTSTDNAIINASAEADLVLQKRVWEQGSEAWVDAVTETAGEEAWFRVDVRNDGPSDVIAPIVVEDMLPAGLTFDRLAGEDTLLFWQAVPGEVDPETGEQTVVFTPRDDTAGLNAGQELPPLRYVTSIDSAVLEGAALVNGAEVTSGTTERDPSNNSDTAQVDVQRAADLSIAKAHEASDVRVGDELPFSLVVTNHGPSVASGIVVTDTVPAGLEVLSEVGDEAAGWIITGVIVNDDGTTTVSASRADADEELAVGASTEALTVVTRVLAAAYPSVTNIADVTGNEPDRDPSNNRDDDEVTVPPLATLITEKQAVGEFKVGERATYEITVANQGPTRDPGPITVVDRLPAGLSFHSSPDSGVRVQGSTVTWTLDGLDVGEQVTLTLVVNVGVAAYPSVVNVVEVSSVTQLTPDSRVTSEAITTVTAADPLAITGADSAALWIVLALLLVLGGAAVLLAVMRRKRSGVSATERNGEID